MYLAIIVLYFYFSNSCNLVHYGHAIESPQYTVVHSESDFEVRLYMESSWMSALVPGTTSFNFEESTKYGFHRFSFNLYYNNQQLYTLLNPIFLSH